MYMFIPFDLPTSLARLASASVLPAMGKATVLCPILQMLSFAVLVLLDQQALVLGELTSDNKTILNVGGIFPMQGGWKGGEACLPSAKMALEDVNKHPDLLPGYHLKLEDYDSECNPGLGTHSLYQLLYNPPTKIMLLGPGCSSVSTRVAEAARMWNFVLLSYGSSSPALSNRERFPTFFRTHPSAIIHNPTRIRLFEEWNWKKIATIQETQEVFTSTIDDLEEKVKVAGIEITVRQSFLTDPSNAVRNLKRQDARIIVGVFYENMARKVFCEAYREGLYGRKYVWFIIGWYPDNWYKEHDPKVNCTEEQMREVLNYHFTTEVMMLNQDDRVVSISGMTSTQFTERLNSELKKLEKDPENVGGYPEAPLAYDAVWSMALALNKTANRLAEKNKKLEDYAYDQEISHEIFKAMNESEFTGISGQVAFLATGDRIAWTQVEQMIDGKYNKVFFYDMRKDNLTSTDITVQWPEGYDHPPADQTVERTELYTISLPLYATMCSFALLGICAALGFLTFNICYRHTRFIHSSHPGINNIIILGSIVSLCCVFILGIDGKFVNEENYAVACQASTWFLCFGFDLMYGAMFSKVWQVHRLGYDVNSESKRQKLRRHHRTETYRSRSWSLYMVVMAFIFVDVIMLIIWTSVDPMYRGLENLSAFQAPDEENILILPQIELCSCRKHIIWIGIFFAIKGLLLLFGIFLAYETKNITVPELNDSRFVGMSIYNVAVLCCVTGPVTLIITNKQDAVYAFESLGIIMCCVITLALIFIPKVIEIRRNPQGLVSNRTASMPIMSKEEDEKQKRLREENEEIKSQIAEKESRIKQLNYILQERLKQSKKSAVEITSADIHTFVAEDTLQLEIPKLTTIVTPSKTLANKSFKGKERLQPSLSPSLFLRPPTMRKPFKNSHSKHTDISVSDEALTDFSESYI